MHVIFGAETQTCWRWEGCFLLVH